MYLILKPLATVSEEQIGLVSSPFFAVSCLKNSWRGCHTLTGYSDALAACMVREHHNRHWNHKQHSFERLCRLAEEAVLIVLDEHPISAAYHQAHGQWQVTENIWDIHARAGLEQQLQHIQQQKHQQTQRQAQRASTSVSAFIIENISESERRSISLGPHEAPGYQSNHEQPAVYTGNPDAGIEPIFSPMDVVDAMLEGTAIAGIRDYLPSRRNVVKQIKPDVKSGPVAGGVVGGRDVDAPGTV